MTIFCQLETFNMLAYSVVHSNGPCMQMPDPSSLYRAALLINRDFDSLESTLVSVKTTFYIVNE